MSSRQLSKKIAKIIYLCNKMSINTIKIFSLILTIIVGIFDYLSGYELAFSIFYIMPIFFASYFTTKSWGITISIVSSIVWLLSDLLSFHEYSSYFFAIWASIVRLLFFLIITFLLNFLKTNLEKEKEISKVRNELLGMAAHDLRNPISNIYSYISFLENTKSNDENYRNNIFERISDSCTHMLHIIDDMLSISTIEAKTVHLNLHLENYIEVVNISINTYRNIALQKNIKIILENDESNMTIMIDKHKIMQVLDNLISNAIKYSHIDSKILIDIKKENDYIITKIKDSGIGIKKEEIEKIFTPFYKSENKPTGGEKSTGLGLAIVKKIIEAHNGTINVESKQNEGSTMYFQLPCQSLLLSKYSESML